MTESTVLFPNPESRFALQVFEKGLADMIWKMPSVPKAKSAPSTAIRLRCAGHGHQKFAIGTPSYADGKARVKVTFENFGQPKSFVFIFG